MQHDKSEISVVDQVFQYLTGNFDEAVELGTSTNAKPAILIFRVDRREHLNNARKLNLHENVEQWREIV